jgi:hypothetical protein
LNSLPPRGGGGPEGRRGGLLVVFLFRLPDVQVAELGA